MATVERMTEKLNEASKDVLYGQKMASFLSSILKDNVTRQVVTNIPGLGKLITYFDHTGITDRFLQVD
jgi:hypothetical protein